MEHDNPTTQVNWHAVYSSFANSSFDCIGMRQASIAEANSFRCSAVQSSYIPRGVSATRKGVNVYIIRSSEKEYSLADKLESVASIEAFLSETGFHFVGFMMCSVHDAQIIENEARKVFASVPAMRIQRVKKALWIFDHDALSAAAPILPLWFD